MVIFVAVNLIFYVLRTNSVASHVVETVTANTLEHFLCARHSSKHLPCVDSFSPYDSSLRCALLYLVLQMRKQRDRAVK